MNLPKSLNVVVMLGGPSAEREVSLRSGAGVVKALRELGHTVTEIDPKDDRWTLPAGTDVVCLAPLHGTYGEDGTIQAKLDSLGVPYTGCGAEASRIAFDKLATKKVAISRGLPTPRFAVLTEQSAQVPAGWSVPVVLKPLRQGSSVGLQMVDEPQRWQAALQESFRFDTEILLEERIVGRETTVGILDGKALPIVEVRPRQGHYDYRNKYTAGATEYYCPAEFSAETTGRIQEVALGIFKAIGARHYARVDVMVDQQGNPFILEVNTLPGMTETSLMPKAAAAAGLNYHQLCQKLLELAMSSSDKRAYVV